MNRTFTHRTVSALMAVVLLLTGAGDLFGVHPCPHHDPVAAVAAEHHAHHAPAAPADAEADHHDGAPAAPSTEHAACTCLGACPSAPAGELPPLEARPAATIEVADVAAAPDVEVEARLPRSTRYFLPFSQAPPLLG